MKSSFIEIVEDFISLFFPRYCVACEDSLVKGENLVCTRCMLEMPRSNYHLEHENPFFNKFRGRMPVKYVMAYFKFVKSSRVQHILHALKYKNKPELGRMLGQVYGEELIRAGFAEKFDMIIPVPLHHTRKRSRGYNQSEEFGMGLSKILEMPCEVNFLTKVARTQTQTRKSKLNRWDNVKEVFAISQQADVMGKRILLVDDVVTTGATLEACGRILIEAGCKELSLACIAATQ
jgi:ComF family protein